MHMRFQRQYEQTCERSLKQKYQHTDITKVLLCAVFCVCVCGVFKT